MLGEDRRHGVTLFDPDASVQLRANEWQRDKAELPRLYQALHACRAEAAKAEHARLTISDGRHCPLQRLRVWLSSRDASRFLYSVSQISHACCPSQVAARDPSCFSLCCMSCGAVAMLIRSGVGTRPGRAFGTLRSARCSSQTVGDFRKRWVSFWVSPWHQCTGIFKVL